MWPVLYFSQFHKRPQKSYQSKFQGYCTNKTKNKSRKIFSISFHVKVKEITDPVKTPIHPLKITDLGDHFCHERFLFFNSTKTPVFKLYLVYFAESFAAGTVINCATKIFENDVKASPNNNCMSVTAEFSKFSWRRRGKNCDVALR